jgi:transcriptional regulator
MYNLPYFKEQDPGLVRQFIHEHPFAMLIGATKEGLPVATQIPVFIEEKEGKMYLTGHMMRKTDHHLAFGENPNVLCVFSGAHTYVSGSWYSDPQQASTWNYRSVHARGIISFLDDAGLIEVLQKTSLHFEGGNTDSTTVFENLSPEYTGRLMKAIVAFRVEVQAIEHVFKMSQNRDKESYRNIIGKLKGGDAEAQAVAGIMEKGEERLFRKD